MRETARVLKFEATELKTAANINAVLEAIMADLVSGDITPAEASKIQKQVNERIKQVGSAMKTAQNYQRFGKMADKFKQVEWKLKIKKER